MNSWDLMIIEWDSRRFIVTTPSTSWRYQKALVGLVMSFGSKWKAKSMAITTRKFDDGA